MKAIVKRIHSPDIEDIFQYRPNGPFSVLVQFLIGPENEEGEESFDVTVCSPSWLQDQPGIILSGADSLIMKEFDPGALVEYVRCTIGRLRGKSWSEIARQIDRIGKWEFRDYQIDQTQSASGNAMFNSAS